MERAFRGALLKAWLRSEAPVAEQTDIFIEPRHCTAVHSSSMKCAVAFALSPLLACSLAAQLGSMPVQPIPTFPGKPVMLPRFSGTWILDHEHTHLQRERIPEGESRAVIEYDGKTWHYVHTHLEGGDTLPDSWQIRMVVDSPKLHTERVEGVTFHSRIRRVGETLVMSENGTDPNHQHVYNTVTYFLQNDGNTLIQEERSKGPLGTVVNHWVLQRAGTGSTPAADGGGS